MTAYQKQNSNQDIQIIKNPPTQKITKRTCNNRMSCLKVKLQKKNQFQRGKC